MASLSLVWVFPVLWPHRLQRSHPAESVHSLPVISMQIHLLSVEVHCTVMSAALGARTPSHGWKGTYRETCQAKMIRCLPARRVPMRMRSRFGSNPGRRVGMTTSRGSRAALARGHRPGFFTTAKGEKDQPLVLGCISTGVIQYRTLSGVHRQTRDRCRISFIHGTSHTERVQL